MESRLTDLVNSWLEKADDRYPVVLTAHASVQGAKYGTERSVMLGSDLVLPGSLARDPRLDYVALGHIHKPQDLNEGSHPPVIYPGSIERVDFGEAGDDKFFIVAHVSKGKTEVEWRKLKNIRLFVDRHMRVKSKEDIAARLKTALPPAEKLAGAIVRLTIEYPRDWEPLIDDAILREQAREAFEFHLVKRPEVEARIRIPEDQSVGSLTPLELLELYWKANHTDQKEQKELSRLARDVIAETQHASGDHQEQ
jgi:exonuclease SbcD